MTIVVKCRSTGKYFGAAHWDGVHIDWQPRQSRATRFPDRATFREYERRMFPGREPLGDDEIRFVRIVPRKCSVYQDKLLEIAGLFNGWGNGRRMSATKTLKAIGDVLGDPC